MKYGVKPQEMGGGVGDKAKNDFSEKGGGGIFLSLWCPLTYAFLYALQGCCFDPLVGSL